MDLPGALKVLAEVIRFMEYIGEELFTNGAVGDWRKTLVNDLKGIVHMLSSNYSPIILGQCLENTSLDALNLKNNERVDTNSESQDEHHYELLSKFDIGQAHKSKGESEMKAFYSNCSAEQIGSHCQICGSLRMKKEKKKFFFEKDQYRSCWAGLTETHLLIYGNEREPRPLDVIPINGYMSKFAITIREEKKKEWAFEIYHPCGKSLSFIAENQEEMTAWIEKINELGIKYESINNSRNDISNYREESLPPKVVLNKGSSSSIGDLRSYVEKMNEGKNVQSPRIPILPSSTIRVRELPSIPNKSPTIDPHYDHSQEQIYEDLRNNWNSHLESDMITTDEYFAQNDIYDDAGSLHCERPYTKDIVDQPLPNECEQIKPPSLNRNNLTINCKPSQMEYGSEKQVHDARPKSHRPALTPKKQRQIKEESVTLVYTNSFLSRNKPELPIRPALKGIRNHNSGGIHSTMHGYRSELDGEEMYSSVPSPRPTYKLPDQISNEGDYDDIIVSYRALKSNEEHQNHDTRLIHQRPDLLPPSKCQSSHIYNNSEIVSSTSSLVSLSNEESLQHQLNQHSNESPVLYDDIIPFNESNWRQRELQKEEKTTSKLPTNHFNGGPKLKPSLPKRKDSIRRINDKVLCRNFDEDDSSSESSSNGINRIDIKKLKNQIEISLTKKSSFRN